jgi:hypothetical protein
VEPAHDQLRENATTGATCRFPGDEDGSLLVSDDHADVYRISYGGSGALLRPHIVRDDAGNIARRER